MNEICTGIFHPHVKVLIAQISIEMIRFFLDFATENITPRWWIRCEIFDYNQARYGFYFFYQFVL